MACPVLGTLSDLSIASGRFCAVSFCWALSNERVRFMTYFLKASRSFPPSTVQSRGRSANKWDWMFFGWVGILRLLGWQQTNLRVLHSGWRKVSMFVACILHQLSMLCQYACVLFCVLTRQRQLVSRQFDWFFHIRFARRTSRNIHANYHPWLI